MTVPPTTPCFYGNHAQQSFRVDWIAEIYTIPITTVCFWIRNISITLLIITHVQLISADLFSSAYYAMFVRFRLHLRMTWNGYIYTTPILIFSFDFINSYQVPRFIIKQAQHHLFFWIYCIWIYEKAHAGFVSCAVCRSCFDIRRNACGFNGRTIKSLRIVDGL